MLGRLLLAFVCLSSSIAMGQKEGNNWVMPDSLIIEFNSGAPVVGSVGIIDPGLYYYRDTYTNYSDTNGILVIYSNGKSFYSLDETLIVDEVPFQYEVFNTRGQAHMFLKKSNSEIYYVANNGLFETNHQAYSIYSLSENVFTSLDNILFSFENGLQVNSSIAIKHGNGRDWWLVSSTYDTIAYEGDEGNSMNYLINLYTTDFVTPVQLFESTTIHGVDGISVYGRLVASNAGDQIVKVEGDMLHFYSFDRCSGEMADSFSIYNIDSVAGYLAEFSPDDSKLYITTRTSYIGLGHPYSPAAIIQYCLDCGGDIASTKDTIYQFPTDKLDFYGMKLGPDGKIYLTAAKLDLAEDDPLPDYQTHFWVINHPDSLGAACDLDTASISSGGRNLASSFPNIPNYQLGPWRGSPCDTLEEFNAVIETSALPFKAYPNPVQDYLYIDNPLQTTCQAVVYNAMGQEVESCIVQAGGQTVSTSTWPTGIYQLIIQQENDSRWKQSLIKMEPR